MGNRLSDPVLDAHGTTLGTKTIKAVGISIQGYRVTDEDALTITKITNNGRQWYLMVIADGHGGPYMSKHLIERLPDYLSVVDLKDDTEIEDSFIKLDNDLHDIKVNDSYGRRQDGTTATITLLSTSCLCKASQHEENQWECIFINLGDSRSVASCNDVVTTTVDHKPGNPDEKERIKKAGGQVTGRNIYRIDGQLSVSRSFGDYSLKSLETPREKTKVSVIPTITRFNVSSGAYGILACDGIWDIQSNKQVLDEFKVPEELSAESVTEYIRCCITEKDTNDNCSLIVWHLVDGSDLESGDVILKSDASCLY